MNADDRYSDGWTETHAQGTVEIIGERRLLLTNSGQNSDVVIAGLPPGGYGSRPAVTIEAREGPALMMALQQMHWQRKDNQP